MKNGRECTIYLTDRRAVCPACSGIALLHEAVGKIQCMDCKSTYQIKDLGRTDKELVCIRTA